MTILKGHPPFFSSFSVVRPTQCFGTITKKGEKERKKKRQGLTFLTLINSIIER